MGKGNKEHFSPLPMSWLRSGNTSRSLCKRKCPHCPKLLPAKVTSASLFSLPAKSSGNFVARGLQDEDVTSSNWAGASNEFQSGAAASGPCKKGLWCRLYFSSWLLSSIKGDLPTSRQGAIADQRFISWWSPLQTFSLLFTRGCSPRKIFLFYLPRG